MSNQPESTESPQVTILPLVLWVLYLGYCLFRVMTGWLLRWIVTPKRQNLPRQTAHQKEPNSARMAWLLYAKLNHYRLTQGLPQMIWNEQLEASALFHGQRMADTREFSHTLSDGVELDVRVKRAGYRYYQCAENLAYVEYPQYSIEQLAHKIHDGWVHSPGHHANLVGDCEEVGIGVIRTGNRWYAVQNFGTPQSAGAFSSLAT